MDYKNYNDYELIDKIQEKDEDSKNILFDKYQPLIHKLANEYYQRYSNYGYQYEDFVQEGMIAFYKALSSYDDQKDSLFYSFAFLCIERNLYTFCKIISNSIKNISSRYVDDIDEYCVEDKRSDIQEHFLEQEQQEFVKTFIFG